MGKLTTDELINLLRGKIESMLTGNEHLYANQLRELTTALAILKDKENNESQKRKTTKL